MADIHIKDIFFSYVFCCNCPDETSIKYCKELNINYILLNNDNFQVVDSQINPKIEAKYRYFISPKEENQTFVVNNLDIELFFRERNIIRRIYNFKNIFTKKKKF